jgi:hypothetical protein
LKRKLLILNVVLLALVLWVGAQIRRQFLSAKAREREVLGKRVAPVPPPPVAKLPPSQPVTAATYAEIAQKMLFAKDRNPTVIIEEAPPPPKPLPPLPLVHGVMEFPDGPMVMMAPKSGAADRGYRIGDEIGEFKLMAVDAQTITFEWDGKPVVRRLDEVIERKAEPAPASGGISPAVTPAAQTKRAPAAPTGQPAPGVSIGAGVKACQPGDTSPAGTIADGMRKVVTPSPFGQVCRWEPVQ